MTNQGQLFTKVAHFTKSGMRTILLVHYGNYLFLSFLCCAIYFLLRTQIVVYRVGLTPSHPDIHIERLRFPIVHWPAQIQGIPFTTLFPVGRMEFTPKTILATSWNGWNMFVVLIVPKEWIVLDCFYTGVSRCSYWICKWGM